MLDPLRHGERTAPWTHPSFIQAAHARRAFDEVADRFAARSAGERTRLDPPTAWPTLDAPHRHGTTRGAPHACIHLLVGTAQWAARSGVAKQWLPKLLDDRVSSFVSFSDIERGERWFDRLLDELRNADAAIVCLTPENIDSRWMHFEAGMVYGRAHVFPYFLGEETGQIQDPLNGVQATAATIVATAQLAGRLLELAGAKGEGAQMRIAAAWLDLAQVIRELASPKIGDIFSGFGQLFERKTFHEPLVDCADQSWLKRYDGARDTARALAAQRPTVVRAGQAWQHWLYDKLQHQVDGYIDELRRYLIVERAFESDTQGHIDFQRPSSALGAIPPGNPGVSCERRCREIRHVVSCLESDFGEPGLTDSLAFSKLARNQYDDKKRIVHARPAPVTWQSLELDSAARRSSVLQPYLAGLSATFVGAWLTELTSSMLPLALGASLTLMCIAPVIRDIWTKKRKQ